MFNKNVNSNDFTKNDYYVKNNNLGPIDIIVEILSIGIIRLELKKLKNSTNFNNNSNSDPIECSFNSSSKTEYEK